MRAMFLRLTARETFDPQSPEAAQLLDFADELVHYVRHRRDRLLAAEMKPTGS